MLGNHILGGIPSPNPSYKQDIKVVTGENTIIKRGTNIIGLDTNQYKVTLKTGDKITCKNEGSNALTLNMFTNYGDTSRNDYWSVGSNATRTITVAHDTNAIAWASAPDSTAWGNYGDSILSYEPYITPISKPLNLGSLELCKIGTVNDVLFHAVSGDKYYDSLSAEEKALLDVDDWYKHEKIEKVDFDSLSWTGNSMTYSDFYRYTTTGISNIKYVSSNSQLGNGIAEKYINHTGSGLSNTKYCFAIDTSMVQATDLRTNTPSGLFYYELLNPVFTKITNTTLISQLNDISSIKSNNGTTILVSDFQTGNAPINFDVSALKGATT